MNCLTCTRKLQPLTHVPHKSSSDEYREQQIIKRNKEIEMNKVGLYGEAQFCNKDCATFFARSALIIFQYVTLIPDSAEDRIKMVGKYAQKAYPHVRDRMKIDNKILE